MITGCEHVGLQVSDVERSASFYESLGLRRLSRFQKSEPYVQRVVGAPGVELDIVMLAIPGSDVELELIEYRGVDGTPVDPNTVNPGTAHFSLFVDDLGELYERLRAEGVEFVSRIETAVAGPIAGQRLVYLKDPDGIRVELVERPAPRAA